VWFDLSRIRSRGASVNINEFFMTIGRRESDGANLSR
jgi:hypothetical protein